MGRKHRLGTECREYKYRGEWDGNTGWELNAESTSRGETCTLYTQVCSHGKWEKHRLGTECREYKYRGEWEQNTGWELSWELSAESTSTGESGNKTQAGN